jgi:hypothetical protein
MLANAMRAAAAILASLLLLLPLVIGGGSPLSNPAHARGGGDGGGGSGGGGSGGSGGGGPGAGGDDGPGGGPGGGGGGGAPGAGGAGAGASGVAYTEAISVLEAFLRSPAATRPAPNLAASNQQVRVVSIFVNAVGQRCNIVEQTIIIDREREPVRASGTLCQQSNGNWALIPSTPR